MRVFILLLILVSGEVWAEYLTGNQLLKLCQTMVNGADIDGSHYTNLDEAQEGATCAGYLMGLITADELKEEFGERWVCVDGAVSSLQLARIVAKYLREQPEQLISGQVLSASQPCNKRSPRLVLPFGASVGLMPDLWWEIPQLNHRRISNPVAWWTGPRP